MQDIWIWSGQVVCAAIEVETGLASKEGGRMQEDLWVQIFWVLCVATAIVRVCWRSGAHGQHAGHDGWSYSAAPPASSSTTRRPDLAVARNRVPTPIGLSVIFSDRSIRGL
jgi:hypothetical protein